jgi:hypothetical protein
MENVMKFLVQDSAISESQLTMTKEAVQHLPHELIGVIPFSNELTSNEPLEGLDYIPYGSTLLTKISYDKGFLGLYFDPNVFTYKNAVLNRNDMLNPDFVGTLREAIVILKEDPDKLWFSRPSHDLKHFVGTVDTGQELFDWFTDALQCQSSGSYKMEPEMDIVLSTPRNLKAEWRWFVVNGEIISGSTYRIDGKLKSVRETDKDIIKIAQEKAKLWLPSECCTLDLALVDDEFKVVEMNCINASGAYDCDMKLVFEKLYEYTVKRNS